MKRFLTVFLAFTLATICLVAQPKYVKGYIITNSSDTIYGLIDNSNLNQNFLKCVFVKEPGSEPVTYKPGEIKAYRIINDKYYISARPNPENPADVFMEYLINGAVDLFYYFDEITGPRYYISKENTGLKELKNEKRIREIGERKYEYQTREYIGILKNYFIDYPEIFPRVEKIELKHNHLIDIAEDYHNKICPGEECIMYAKAKLKPEFGAGVIAGASASFFNLSYHAGIFTRIHIPDYSAGFVVGGFADIKDFMLNNKISFRFEGLFYGSNFSTDSTEFKIGMVKATVNIMYNIFQGEKIKPAFFLGTGYNHLLKFSYESRFGPTQFSTWKDFISYHLGLETAYIIKEKLRAFIQLRYEYAQGDHVLEWPDSGIAAFFSKFNNIYVIGGIRF